MGNVDLGNWIIAGFAAFVSIWAWLSSNRTKREQAKQNREKQEYEAFLRIQEMYRNALTVQQAELAAARLQITAKDDRIRHLEDRLNGRPYEDG